MRFIQNTPAPAKEKKEKPAAKFGGKEGKRDYMSLSSNKKIPTKGGYK